MKVTTNKIIPTYKQEYPEISQETIALVNEEKRQKDVLREERRIKLNILSLKNEIDHSFWSKTKNYSEAMSDRYYRIDEISKKPKKTEKDKKLVEKLKWEIELLEDLIQNTELNARTLMKIEEQKLKKLWDDWQLMSKDISNSSLYIK